MIAADRPIQRPVSGKLLVVDGAGNITRGQRSRWIDVLARGDLIVANDAATIPASLKGAHLRTGRSIEVRLAAWHSPELTLSPEFDAIAFGEGDHRTPTEQRPSPPAFANNDRLLLGPLRATVVRLLDHPRFIRLRFDARVKDFWRAVAKHGRSIQYAHVREPLALYDVWTSIARVPVAFEAPSAGFILDWRTLAELAAREIRFATLTHAAGISSTGDADLDRRLPLDEWYELPLMTASAVNRAIACGDRVIAVGTTVVRALEHAARHGEGLRSGQGVARGRIDATTRLRIVDAIVTGTHEPGSSHHDLLRAFIDDDTLARADEALAAGDFRTHEFGDSMLVFRSRHRSTNAKALRAAA